jgi:Flp pilus assembly CpaF family ATPase
VSQKQILIGAHTYNATITEGEKKIQLKKIKHGRNEKGVRTIDPRLEYDSENAILVLLVVNPMRECRAEAEAKRVGHCHWRVDKRHAIARTVERHAEEMGSSVSGRANKHEPRALELKL